MIILGTPAVTIDFGMPGWAVALILGLMAGSYLLGKRQGRKEALEVAVDLEDEIDYSSS